MLHVPSEVQWALKVFFFIVTIATWRHLAAVTSYTEMWPGHASNLFILAAVRLGLLHKLFSTRSLMHIQTDRLMPRHPMSTTVNSSRLLILLSAVVPAVDSSAHAITRPVLALPSWTAEARAQLNAPLGHIWAEDRRCQELKSVSLAHYLVYNDSRSRALGC